MKLLTRAEELILLAIWRLNEDAYCVPILDQVQEVSDKKWTLGSIYITLHRLEKSSFVDSDLGIPTAERGGKRKRFYQVTPKGREALKTIHKVEKAMWYGIKGIVSK